MPLDQTHKMFKEPSINYKTPLLKKDTDKYLKGLWLTILEQASLLLTLAVLILLVVHPWKDNFVHGLATHWDPPVMTSWMAWNAHNILNGRFFLPDYNAPFFYPHSYTLAFSEPFWPQSFIYAIVYSLSQNPFLSFNSTSLFFWAFSGVCMFNLLRELPLSRGASYLGAVAFTLMPYHLAYYVEFNMLLSFIIPLGYMFFIRWLRSVRFRDAILFAFALWLSAISCIYYTIILIIPLFFLLISFLMARPQLLRQKDFYWTGLTALGLTTVLCILYLYPYGILRIEGQYVRTLKEAALHSAQPLSYLRPLKTNVVHSFIKIPAAPVETALFPGIIVTIMACVYWFRSRLVLPIRHSRIVGGLAWSRIVLWMVFWLLVIYGAYHPAAIFFTASSFIIVPAILTVFFITLILLFLRRENGKEQVVLSGMGVGALASFILSLGPVVTVGPVFNTAAVGAGPMALLYRVFPLFGVIRVTSRFSIIVLIFMITAGCFALDGIVKRYQRIRWIWVVLSFLLVGEAFFSKPYAFTDYREISGSKVQKILQQMPHKISIFQMPAGPRELEAVAVLNTVGRFNYSINGLSGFFS